MLSRPERELEASHIRCNAMSGRGSNAQDRRGGLLQRCGQMSLFQVLESLKRPWAEISEYLRWCGSRGGRQSWTSAGRWRHTCKAQYEDERSRRLSSTALRLERIGPPAFRNRKAGKLPFMRALVVK